MRPLRDQTKLSGDGRDLILMDNGAMEEGASGPVVRVGWGRWAQRGRVPTRKAGKGEGVRARVRE